ncbi:hypothetical protein CYMTET_29303, partial [Cymbomonas tetramitiformis]
EGLGIDCALINFSHEEMVRGSQATTAEEAQPNGASGSFDSAECGTQQVRMPDHLRWCEEEAAAVASLDVIYSTERVLWGNSFAYREGTALDDGLSCHMSARAVLAALKQAAEAKKMISTGSLLVYPIFTRKGLPWGCMVHINKTQAAHRLLGGLGLPRFNRGPLAAQMLQNMARAVARGLKKIEDHVEGVHWKAIQTNLTDMREGMNKEMAQGMTPRERLVAAMLQLHEYGKIRKELATKLLRSEQTEQNLTSVLQMEEIPRVLLSILTAVVVMQGTPGAHAYVEDCGARNLCEGGADNKKLQEFIRCSLCVQRRHVYNMFTFVEMSSKGLGGINSVLGIDPARGIDTNYERERRMKIVDVLVQGVSRDAVAMLSETVALLRDWLETSSRQWQLASRSVKLRSGAEGRLNSMGIPLNRSNP